MYETHCDNCILGFRHCNGMHSKANGDICECPCVRKFADYELEPLIKQYGKALLLEVLTASPHDRLVLEDNWLETLVPIPLRERSAYQSKTMERGI